MSSSTSTSTSDSANEENKEKAPVQFQLHRHDILSSKSSHYLALDLKGEGRFGKVVTCVNLTTNKLVAIKIHKGSKNSLIRREVAMLEAVRALGPDKKNIVGFMEHFVFNNLSCLAFEMLDRSLLDLMNERRLMPLSLNEIRPVIHQLLVAFEGLKDIGIIHADLKPDNIMLVNQEHHPFRVKLIDFGLALLVRELETGMTIQATAYRAPEVSLGLPLSEAVDMWGVGCIMAFLYFGMDLFRGNCEYHRMKAMVHMLGQPEDHLLSAGRNTLQYFSKDEDSTSPGWRLKSPEEYRRANGVKTHVSWKFFDIGRNLEEAVQSYPEKRDALEYEDRMAFLSLLKSCLCMNAGCRITPREALKHPFITMVHLIDEVDTSSYADDARTLMTVCPLQNLDESDDSDRELRDDQASDSSDGVSGPDRSSYEESDPGALKTDLRSEPPSASFCEKDSLVGSSGGYDADIGSFSDVDSDSESFSDVDSHSESSTSEDEDTESSSSYHADIDASSNEGDIESAISDSYDGDSFNPSSSDGGNVEPREPCFNLDEVPAATGLESGSSASRDGHSNAENSSHEKSTGPSAATNLYDGVRDTTPTKEESGDAATSNDVNTDTDCVPIASNTNDDRASAAAGSTDGTAASISSNDGATAAIEPIDVGDVKKKKKNLFQRTCKFFCRVKARVVSVFKPRTN